MDRETREELLLTDQKTLIWLKCIEDRVFQNQIEDELLMNSYNDWVSDKLIDHEIIPFSEYKNRCQSLLTLYIALTRALILGDEDVINKHWGEIEASSLTAEISEIYQSLINSLIQEATENSTWTSENKISSNITHILSAKD